MMTHLKYTLRSLLNACRKWGHSYDEAEALVQDALWAVEAYSQNHPVHDPVAHDPEASEVKILEHHSINSAPPAGRTTAAAVNDTGAAAEDVTVLADPPPGSEALCMTPQRLQQIESVVVQRWGRVTYDVLMYLRSGYSYPETAQKFRLTERAVQTHIARAMFVLINHRAGEQE